jgi:hypothetical protein
MALRLSLCFLTLLCIVCVEVWFWFGIALSVLYVTFLFKLAKAVLSKVAPAEPEYFVYDRPKDGPVIYMVNGILTPMEPRKCTFLERLELFLSS